MIRVAVLDDWQGVARGAADWSALQARAEVVFFQRGFRRRRTTPRRSWRISRSCCRCGSARRCRAR